MSRSPTVWVVAALAAVLAVRAKWFSRSTAAAPLTEAYPALPVDEQQPAGPGDGLAPVESSDMTARLPGSWRDQYYGERTMTFREDGTGTMVILLDAVGQAIYGEKLSFDLAWSLAGGVLEMRFTGGEPKDAVKTISQIWGDRHLQYVDLLSESELHLRSTDSDNVYRLKRLLPP